MCSASLLSPFSNWQNVMGSCRQSILLVSWGEWPLKAAILQKCCCGTFYSPSLLTARMQVIPLEVSNMPVQVKPSSAGIKVGAEQWLVCWASGEEREEAEREVSPWSWVQRRNTLWLLMWVHGWGEVLKMRFRYSISPGEVRLNVAFAGFLLFW